MPDEPNASTPPWGDDFDAERAWALIQSLRAEKVTLKGERDTLKTERDTLTADLETARQARTDETDVDGKVAAAEKRATDAERGLYVERALRKHPGLEDLAEFLTGDTEDEIEAKAARLAAIGAKTPPAGDEGEDESSDPDPDAANEDGEPADLSTRPAPSLTPGHGGDESTPFDPVAIAKAARG